MNLAGFLYVRNMEQPNYLSFEKPFITPPTLIIGKTMQCTASYHTFTQQNSAICFRLIDSRIICAT
ncbi:hypothetical protein T4D_5040 [Trichinella pseudospiralis]|uniref:Uncharacterized protein n=1 Tax=Trichinella pseudospiralis TaxID=6337 RepID=A0A0V1F2I7_TRIPS|nr:hypothetical protein T4D_5051 [Trichinella pseudospiralis]KRY80896.1 hypothetical protein T4D_5040 [Trichinella pseudospiralis]